MFETECAQKMNIRIFGKSIIKKYSHRIMKFNIREATSVWETENDLLFKTVSVNEQIEGTYSKSVSQKIAGENIGKCDVFVLYQNEKPLGTISVMYKGGNELEYKIRNIEAFIYNVYVAPEARGKGFAGKMMQFLMSYLREKGINEAYLAVSTDNESAIRAYEKFGFCDVENKSFYRILRKNMPYHTL